MGRIFWLIVSKLMSLKPIYLLAAIKSHSERFCYDFLMAMILLVLINGERNECNWIETEGWQK